MWAASASASSSATVPAPRSPVSQSHWPSRPGVGSSASTASSAARSARRARHRAVGEPDGQPVEEQVLRLGAGRQTSRLFGRRADRVGSSAQIAALSASR